jgi:hypothetical protein
MRPIACASAALMLAVTVACNDRDRDDTASRIDNAGAEAAAADFRGYSYARREEFHREVRERLDRMDAELAELERDTKESASESQAEAVAAARRARIAVERNVERLAKATEAS